MKIDVVNSERKFSLSMNSDEPEKGCFQSELKALVSAKMQEYMYIYIYLLFQRMKKIISWSAENIKKKIGTLGNSKVLLAKL